MKAPGRRSWRLAAICLGMALVVLAAPLWLPLFGTALAVDDPVDTADVALVLEGSGPGANDAAETWRQEGVVRDVVIVEAPVKTHALVAYWSDFVAWGLAAPASTPLDHLQVVRAESTQGVAQARAALPALQADAARTVLVSGGGGIGSRLVERELLSVFGPARISIRMVHDGNARPNPGRWYMNAYDRRAVLDSWLQLLLPFMNG